jgi:RNA polymerase sigma factor CnrH
VSHDDAVSAATDRELASSAIAGQAEAFSLLAARHKTWLYRFIRRYVGNEADALDVLQDTMVATWLALGRYKLDRPFEAWVRQIALNKCRDWSRRAVFRSVVGFLAGGPDDVPADALRSNPEMICLADEVLVCLDNAISSLPRSLREPFILIVFEGLSHRQTSQLLKISEKAVETRLYRARQRLSSAVARADLAVVIQGAPT